jgi:hypothetical protein
MEMLVLWSSKSVKSLEWRKRRSLVSMSTLVSAGRVTLLQTPTGRCLKAPMVYLFFCHMSIVGHLTVLLHATAILGPNLMEHCLIIHNTHFWFGREIKRYGDCAVS